MLPPVKKKRSQISVLSLCTPYTALAHEESRPGLVAALLQHQQKKNKALSLKLITITSCLWKTT